jgi:hypothetical protein
MNSNGNASEKKNSFMCLEIGIDTDYSSVHMYSSTWDMHINEQIMARSRMCMNDR